VLLCNTFIIIMMIAAIIKDHIESDMSHLVSSDTMLDRIDLHNERD